MQSSELLNALSLNASMTVKDLDASLAWYCDILGFEVGQRYEREGVVRAVQLTAGSVLLLLTPDDGAKGFDRAKGQGISLRLTTAQNIDELASRSRSSSSCDYAGATRAASRSASNGACTLASLSK